MRSQLLLVCGIALLSAASLSAQQMNPPKQLLPKQFRDWQLTRCFKGDAVGVNALWKEAGLRNTNECEYSSNGKTVPIRLEQYADPSAAYEVYTSLQRPGMMPTKLGHAAAFDKDGVLIQEGTLVLSSAANISRDDLAALVKAVEADSENTTPLPPLRTYLPIAGRVVGTERYALGPEALQ